MFGLATILQIIFSIPMFSVWRNPAKAAPASTEILDSSFKNSGILSYAVCNRITTATGE